MEFGKYITDESLEGNGIEQGIEKELKEHNQDLENMKDILVQDSQLKFDTKEITRSHIINILKGSEEKTFKDIYKNNTNASGVIFAVQYLLSDLGDKPGKIDGLYGGENGNTRKAVKSFQEKWNKDNTNDKIKEDGRAGPETIKKILKKLNTTQEEVVEELVVEEEVVEEVEGTETFNNEEIIITDFEYKMIEGTPYIIGKDQEGQIIQYPVGNVENIEENEVLPESITNKLDRFMLFINGLNSVGKNIDINKIEGEIQEAITTAIENAPENGTPMYSSEIDRVISRSVSDLEDLKNSKSINIVKRIEDGPEIKVLEVLRTEGAYEFVSEYIVENQIESALNISNDDLNRAIVNISGKDYESFPSSVKSQISKEKFEEISEDFTDKIKKSEKMLSGMREEMQEEYKNNPELKQQFDSFDKFFKSWKSIAEESFKKKIGSNLLLQGVIEENHIEGGTYNGGLDNSFMGLYSGINGLGWLDMADKTRDITKEVAKMVAIEAVILLVSAVTAGVATGFLHAVVWGTRGVKLGRMAMKGYRVANRASKGKSLNLARRAMQGGKFGKGAAKLGIGTTTLATETTAFYEISNISHNLINGNNAFEGWNDRPEITKTAVMLGAFRLANKVISIGKIGVGKAKVPNPLNKLSLKSSDAAWSKGLKFGGQTIVGGSVIFGIEGVGEMIIDGNSEPWTKEEFLQSMLMYSAMLIAGNISNVKFTKKNGRLKTSFTKKGKGSKKENKGETKKQNLENSKQNAVNQKRELSTKIQTNQNKLNNMLGKQKTYGDKMKKLDKQMEANVKSGNSKDNKELERQYKILENANKKLQGEINGLKKSISAQETKLQELNKKIQAEASKSKGETQKQAEASKSKGETQKQAKNNNEKVNDNVNVTNELNKLKNQKKVILEANKSKLAKIKENKVKIEELKNNMGRKEELAELNKSLRNAKSEAGRTDLNELQLKQAQNKVKQIETQIVKRNADIIKLEQQNVRLRREILRNQTQLGKINAEISSLQFAEAKVKNIQKAINKNSESSVQPKEAVKDRKLEIKPNKPNNLEKLADDFDRAIFSKEGVNIGGKNYKLEYKPAVSQNASKKGQWEYSVDGKIVTTAKSNNPNLVPENSNGNRIRDSFNKIRNDFIKENITKNPNIKSFPTKESAKAKIINMWENNKIDWKKGVAAAALIGGAVYIFKTFSDNDNVLQIKETNSENLVIKEEEEILIASNE